MSHYTARIIWTREADASFVDGRYSRAHRWQFDGGIEVAASSSPHVVRLPFSKENAVDPEEAFVASLSSCHMLWFLSLAMKDGYCIDAYEDLPLGTMAKNADGKMAITEVVMRPWVRCSGDKQPDRASMEALHRRAHESCFIANSVTTTLRCEPRWVC